MLDFTRNVKLTTIWKRRYARAQTALYLCFALVYLAFAYKTVFPSLGFFYDFNNEGSLKNTIFKPRYSENGPVLKGNYINSSPIVFDAALIGNFSDVAVSVTLDKKSPLPHTGSVQVRKSYRSFFYPVGKAAGFRDGSLLVSDDTYWIISNGQKREFPSLEVMYALGFPKTFFTSVTTEELSHNETGSDVRKDAYPDGTVFKVDADYYQLIGGQLLKFSSPKAFLSNLNPNYAIPKNQNLLASYPLGEKIIGYADGTLASTNDAIYILSRGSAYPFDSPQTFEALGYDWNDVAKISSDELGLYEKQKTALNNQPHPDGTVFLDTQDNAYYLVSNGSKLPLLGQNIVDAYLKGSPIKANGKSLEIKASCNLSKDLLARRYTCTIPTAPLDPYNGNDFQFTASTDTNLKIDQITVTFFTSPTVQNIIGSLAKLKSRIGDNYLAN